MTEQTKPIAVLIAEMRGEIGERLGRIEERQEASKKAADHRHGNATMALQHLSDKVDKCVTHDEHEDLKDRVKGIETTHKRIASAAVIGAAGAGGFFVMLGKKLGFGS